jgi:hypothetical protein
MLKRRHPAQHKPDSSYRPFFLPKLAHELMAAEQPHDT